MKLHMLKSQRVSVLRNDIENNLDKYRSGNFEFLFTDYTSSFECDVEIDESLFESFVPGNSNASEVANCKLILNALGNLTPYMARDERLWVYLTHSYLLDYTRKRWPIPVDNEKAIKHIATHFFAKDKRDIDRNNAASRLWWQATLCNRVKDLKLESSLECFLEYSDVRANIIERPSTAQCINVFSAIMKKLNDSYKGDKSLFKRETFRYLMKELNTHGGIKLLNAMEESEIMKFIDATVMSCMPVSATS